MEKKIDEKEFQAGERLYLGKTVTDEASLNEHFDRYRFAISLMPEGATVLDAACGTGYGTQLLSKKAKEVFGVEISEHALEWGKAHHQEKNIQFINSNLNNTLPFESNTFDMITSFETLEHVESHENMIKEFKRVLRPGGLLILSSPDREIITDIAHTENKFHIHELSKKEFVNLLKSNFSLLKLMGQTLYMPPALWKKAIKILAKLDIFKLRRKIVKVLGLKLFVHHALSIEDHTPLTEVSFDEPNKYFVLVAVCRKDA